jgi:hypothetical protein
MSTTTDSLPPLLPIGARVGLDSGHAVAFLEKLQALCLEFQLAIDTTEDVGLALVPLSVDVDEVDDDDDDAAEVLDVVYAYFSIGDDGSIEWAPAIADGGQPSDDCYVVEVRS